MVELLILILFGWILFNIVRLMFKVAWELVKIFAALLFIMALTPLIGYLL